MPITRFICVSPRPPHYPMPRRYRHRTRSSKHHILIEKNNKGQPIWYRGATKPTSQFQTKRVGKVKIWEKEGQTATQPPSKRTIKASRGTEERKTKWGKRKKKKKRIYREFPYNFFSWLLCYRGLPGDREEEFSELLMLPLLRALGRDFGSDCWGSDCCCFWGCWWW